MEYYAGHLTISAEDAAQLISTALRACTRWISTIRPRFSWSTRHANHDSQRYAALAAQELQTARTLLAQGQVRAAGCVAGVAMELHLKHVAVAHGITIPQYASIALLQDALRRAGIVQPQHRKLLKRCSAIRNQCVHARRQLPSRESVAKLITTIEALQQSVR